RNLPKVKVLLPEGLNVYDVLWADKVVIHKDALEGIYRKVEA
ncbi:MAG: 50S ribosomal protein L4, partial [Aquificae bacterium]|nr:50S ribosomal protein L4 [Aquificota bacterium]